MNKKLKTAIFSFIIFITLLISGCKNIHENFYNHDHDVYNRDVYNHDVYNHDEDNHDIEVGFSPGHTASKIIISAIEKSKRSILIAAYSFTSKPIALALVKAQKRGVHVHLVVDKKVNTSRYTAVTYLVNHFVPVRFNDKYSIMHDKFMIIDNISVETGSFNYTQSAMFRNAENVIYIKNRRDIARQYLREFDRLWNEGIDAKPTY
ncbi:endonuclease (plasmid) [Candidatus Pantoea edessiphila]|uniref:phospholipase D n=1 Tax=Candidatus Pantoea edessiphila TaxID=2044610 RepID=A0A2P5SZ61_9GAMM|nr:phospholipase D family protein [Candidatus Pantoea edessiphila]PPI87624.1 endonuclease [Candidatus Pantoea edessiphila]